MRLIISSRCARIGARTLDTAVTSGALVLGLECRTGCASHPSKRSKRDLRLWGGGEGVSAGPDVAVKEKSDASTISADDPAAVLLGGPIRRRQGRPCGMPTAQRIPRRTPPPFFGGAFKAFLKQAKLRKRC